MASGSASPPPSLKAGVRIQLDSPDGEKGTIRYVGPIRGAKNPFYVGVEWDLKRERGHDGTVKGNRYFTCPPGFGSCIHPKRALVGMTLFEAVEIQYGGKCDPDEARIAAFRRRNEAKREAMSASASPPTTTQQSLGGRKSEGEGSAEAARKKDDPPMSSEGNSSSVHFKLVGEEKIRSRLKQYRSLDHVSDFKTKIIEKLMGEGGVGVDSMRISRAGPSQELKELVGIKSLSLENNLLRSWKEIAVICCGLPTLEELRMGENNLPNLLSLPPKSPALEEISSMFSGGNNDSPKPLSNLKPMTPVQILVLNRFPYSCEAVTALGVRFGLLTSLEELHMCKNDLSSLPKELFSAKDALPKLHLLQDNLVGKTYEISGPRPAVRAASIIRRIAPQLKHLRIIRCRSTYLESKGAAFLKQIPYMVNDDDGDVPCCWFSAIEHKTAIHAHESSHTQRYYEEYLERHGVVNASSAHAQKAAKLSSKLMKITLQCDETKKSKEKKLPGTMQVSKLKLLSRRLFRLDKRADITLRLTSKERGAHKCVDSSARNKKPIYRRK
eukprot:jgi/Bigna1/75689/fgenesh1_pg.36_\